MYFINTYTKQIDVDEHFYLSKFYIKYLCVTIYGRVYYFFFHRNMTNSSFSKIKKKKSDTVRTQRYNNKKRDKTLTTLNQNVRACVPWRKYLCKSKRNCVGGKQSIVYLLCLQTRTLLYIFAQNCKQTKYKNIYGSSSGINFFFSSYWLYVYILFFDYSTVRCQFIHRVWRSLSGNVVI